MRAKPIDRESPFQIEEIFFSKTDTRGIIKSGNSVFVRVSEYAYEDIMGQPHNFIRHPDMPKTVFKLLWDFIQNQRPIGAYVKNMSKSGSYYWVFAVVFPIRDGYLSLRLKPTSPILNTIKELYRTVAQEEKTSLEHGTEFLLKKIRELGFRDYDHFMTEAMMQEMQARDKHLKEFKNESSSKDLGRLKELIHLSDGCEREFSGLFNTLIEFVSLSNSMRTKADEMLESFKTLNHLSVNMAVGAEKAGQDGATLAQVAVGFKTVADEIEEQMRIFNTNLDKVVADLGASQFQIGAARLQVETIQFFLNELSDKERIGESFDEAEFIGNQFDLVSVVEKYSNNVVDQLAQLSQTILGFKSRMDSLMTTLSGLQVIRVSGKIEAAKMSTTGTSNFLVHIEGMEQFIKKIAAPSSEVATIIEKFVTELKASLESLRCVEKNIPALREVPPANIAV